MNGALALDVADNLRHSVFGRNQNHHVHMIGHQMAFLDPAVLLFGQSPKHLSKMLAYMSEQRLLSALGNKNDVIFAAFRVV